MRHPSIPQRSLVAPEPAYRRLPVLFLPFWIMALLFTRSQGAGSELYEGVELLGFALIFAGALGRLWCRLYSVGEDADALPRHGPYSLSRNPLYFFSLMVIVGICLGMENGFVAVISAIAALAYFAFVLPIEEGAKLYRFRDAFLFYSARVPRLFPRFAFPRTRQLVQVDLRKLSLAILDVAILLSAVVFIEGLEMVESVHLLPHIPVPF